MVLQTLAGLSKNKSTLIGIDSDGCVFDSMKAKQVSCFHPEMIRVWRLEKIESVVRETAEFVNLYSRWRGTNRFPALWKTFDLLARRPEIRAAGIALPDRASLKRFVDSACPLSQDTLADEVARSGDPELGKVLEWSRSVNASVERNLGDLPVFPGVREALERLAEESELIVVSQTPEEALLREWKAQGLDPWVSVIAGQEQGTKKEQLIQALNGRWDPDSVLLVGDAPGDLAAARGAATCFFPVNPGDEFASWVCLRGEAQDRFLRRQYRGDYEDALIRKFLARLPETPPWESTPGA